MDSDRRLRILAALVRSEPPPIGPASVCRVAVAMTGVTGAGLMVVDSGASRGSLCATDDVSARIEELQFALGEGPCIDTCRVRRPVLEPDLAAPVTSRWPAFAPAELDAGVRAAFGFPVRVGAALLGALDLYRDVPGELSVEQHADALVLADVAAEVVLLLQAGAAPGDLAAELEADASFHYVVHQASGMIAAQLDVPVDQALVRLRARAFRSGVSVVDLARRIVDRSARFSPDDELAGEP